MTGVATGFGTDGDLFAFSLTSRLLIEYLADRRSVEAAAGFVSNVSYALGSFSFPFSRLLLGSISFKPLVRRVVLGTSFLLLDIDGSTGVALASDAE